MKKDKVSIVARIFGCSIWMVLFAWEGSFSIQCIIPFLILLLAYEVLNKKLKYTIDLEAKLLLCLVSIIIISTGINTLRYIEIASMSNIIGIIYFITIFLWYYLVTSKKYSQKDIEFIINNYIIVATICSVLTIRMSLSGYAGKIAIINFIGTLTDENHTSAIISLAPIYCLIMLWYYKKNKIIYGSLLGINALGICLTGSRASMLAMILGMAITFMMYFTTELNGKKIIKMGFLLLIISIVASYIISLMPTWIFNRYFKNSYVDNSNNTRIEIWKNAIEGITDQPFLGFGTGTFHKLPKYAYTCDKSVPAHETFLDIGLYSGVFGMIIFIIFVVKHINPLLKEKKLRIFLGGVIDLLFISVIIGADKSIFLWNTLILLNIVENNKSKKDILEKEKNSDYSNTSVINNNIYK